MWGQVSIVLDRGDTDILAQTYVKTVISAMVYALGCTDTAIGVLIIGVKCDGVRGQ
ncbi:hypothetical protein AF72_07325 [Xylella taiwanensis]|uniref:Uncharacterized protein n=1 Tax=Xylella taiwanensis TaxID=1444770 RepID=Z9JJX5_9GAMM|nr:hypothetical protein AF72_07325 [Xylella taiwanensis]